MKKLLLFILLCLPAVVHAQGVQYVRREVGDGGTPVPYPLVTVCTSAASFTPLPCTGKASIYADSLLSTPLANPFRGDQFGNIEFYALAGTYIVSVSDPYSPGYSFKLVLSTGAGFSPYRNVIAYGASGSTQTTTSTGNFNSSTLTLASALDFVNGQTIRMVGPGTVNALAVPTGLAITPEGATGATTYTYKVACVGPKWGVTAASAGASTGTGNATLTYANFNQVGWSADTGCIYYAVWETVPVAKFEGITPNLFWYDYGQAAMSVPSTIPATPPVSAQAGFYYGKILAGGGSTTLTMDTPAGSTVGATTVEHDDSAAVQAAMNAATLAATGLSNGTQDRVFFPPGNYNITQPLIPNANPVGLNFFGNGQATLLAHVPGEAMFLIKNNNQDLAWQGLYFLLSASSTVAHTTQSAPTVRTKFDQVSASGSAAGGGYTTFYRQDGGQIIFNMTRSTASADVNLRFGEPGHPSQVDDVHVDQSDFYTGPNGTNENAGMFQIVGDGSTGVIQFSNTLIEGPVPAGTSFPWFRLANSPQMTFKNVEFAPENTSAGVGAMFQGWAGMPVGGGPITFEQSPVASIGTGGVFDFSAATPSSSNPAIVLRESSATASGGAQVFHAGTDATGLSCENSRLTPTQTLFSFHVEAKKCFGLAGFTDNSNQLYLRGYSGATQDPFAIDDFSGNPLLHMNTSGALLFNGGTPFKPASPGTLGGTTPGIGHFTTLDTTAGFTALPDGVHNGISSLVGNTADASLPTNTVSRLGPSLASFTAFGERDAGAEPTVISYVAVGASAGHITQKSYVNPVFTAQTDAATVTWAIGSALVANASLTFTAHGGTRTLNLTGLVNGGSYVLWLKQDGTGGEGLTLGTGCTWKVSGGGAGAVTTSVGANAVDVLAFTYDGTNCYANFNKNFN